MMNRFVQCASNSPPFTLMQNFVPALTSILTNVKDFEIKEYKIPLLFSEDDSAIDRWVEIEKGYIKGKLLDTQGNVQKNYDLKRKSFE